MRANKGLLWLADVGQCGGLQYSERMARQRAAASAPCTTVPSMHPFACMQRSMKR